MILMVFFIYALEKGRPLLTIMLYYATIVTYIIYTNKNKT